MYMRHWLDTRKRVIRTHGPRKYNNKPCPISGKKVGILSDFGKMVQKCQIYWRPVRE